MPIKASWKDEARRVLLYEILDNWTWEEYDLAVDNGLIIAQDVQHHFVQLIDMRLAKAVPTGTAIPHILRGRRTRIPNLGITVIVGADLIIKTLVYVFEKAMGQTYPSRYLVQTMEEAERIIEAYFAEREKPE